MSEARDHLTFTPITHGATLSSKNHSDEGDEDNKSLEAFLRSIPEGPEQSESHDVATYSEAPIPVLHFTLHGEHYAIAGEHIREVILASELTPLPGAPDYILGVMVHRRHVIGVLDLASWLERPHTGMPDGTERLVIIEHGDMTAGICTDAFTQIVDIPHHKLEQARSKHHRAIHHNPYISAILPIREHAVPLLHITKLLSDAALNH